MELVDEQFHLLNFRCNFTFSAHQTFHIIHTKAQIHTHIPTELIISEAHAHFFRSRSSHPCVC